LIFAPQIECHVRIFSRSINLTLREIAASAPAGIFSMCERNNYRHARCSVPAIGIKAVSLAFTYAIAVAYGHNRNVCAYMRAHNPICMHAEARARVCYPSVAGCKPDRELCGSQETGLPLNTLLISPLPPLDRNRRRNKSNKNAQVSASVSKRGGFRKRE